METRPDLIPKPIHQRGKGRDAPPAGWYLVEYLNGWKGGKANPKYVGTQIKKALHGNPERVQVIAGPFERKTDARNERRRRNHVIQRERERIDQRIRDSKRFLGDNSADELWGQGFEC